MTADAKGLSFAARCLGFGGLILLVGLTAPLWLALSASRPMAAMALLGYGAAICSFLGAIHRGLSMRDSQAQRASSLLRGVTPSLLGRVAWMLGPTPSLWLVAATLWSCFAVDRVAYRRGASSSRHGCPCGLN